MKAVIIDSTTNEYIKGFNWYGDGVETTNDSNEALGFDYQSWTRFEEQHNETGDYNLLQLA